MEPMAGEHEDHMEPMAGEHEDHMRPWLVSMRVTWGPRLVSMRVTWGQGLVSMRVTWGQGLAGPNKAQHRSQHLLARHVGRACWRAAKATEWRAEPSHARRAASHAANTAKW